MTALLEQLTLVWQGITAYLAVDAARLAEPDMIARLSLQVLLLLGSAFFSGSETALFSLSRLDLEKLRRERHRHSESLHELLEQPRRLIISILCGNELINIAASANMTGLLVSLYGVERAGLIATLVMVPLLLLFGEVTPKTIAVSNPVRISAGLVAAPMTFWVKIATPLRWAIRGMADRVTTMIVGKEKAAENILQLDEFRTLVEAVANEGELDATERVLIYNLLESSDTEIVEIMTPRTRTAFLNADMSVPEMVERFKSYRHPRVPVFRVHRDNIVGFVHAEDVLRLVLDDVDLTQLTPEDIMRPPVVVPLTKSVDEMFDFFQDNNARAAAVLNEFGGMEGFITMKDTLTFIFGQISGDITGQEHYQERDENVYEVPGDMKLTDFNVLTNFGLEDPRMTTIGGVAFRHLDRLPKENDQVAIDGIIITVLEMDAHRIARVRVSKGNLEEEASQAETPQTDTELAEASEQPLKEPDEETPGQPHIDPLATPLTSQAAGTEERPDELKRDTVQEESAASPQVEPADVPEDSEYIREPEEEEQNELEAAMLETAEQGKNT
jgi:CBS domain containing-hemolysin-like protein